MNENQDKNTAVNRKKDQDCAEEQDVGEVGKR